MGWEEIFKIIIAMLGSVGTASAIIFALSSWLGKVWASRILEKERSEHEKEIEKYRNDLEQIKITFLRYSNKQFELYNKFWESLCDLENSADALFFNTDNDTLENFIKQFEATRLCVKKSFLFIEKSHFEKLEELFNKVKDYQIGKEKLLEMRNLTIPLDDVKKASLKIILGNFMKLHKYKSSMEEIGEELKEQLK